MYEWLWIVGSWMWVLCEWLMGGVKWGEVWGVRSVGLDVCGVRVLYVVCGCCVGVVGGVWVLST